MEFPSTFTQPQHEVSTSMEETKESNRSVSMHSTVRSVSTTSTVSTNSPNSPNSTASTNSTNSTASTASTNSTVLSSEPMDTWVLTSEYVLYSVSPTLFDDMVNDWQPLSLADTRLISSHIVQLRAMSVHVIALFEAYWGTRAQHLASHELQPISFDVTIRELHQTWAMTLSSHLIMEAINTCIRYRVGAGFQDFLQSLLRLVTMRERKALRATMCSLPVREGRRTYPCLDDLVLARMATQRLQPTLMQLIVSYMAAEPHCDIHGTMLDMLLPLVRDALHAVDEFAASSRFARALYCAVLTAITKQYRRIAPSLAKARAMYSVSAPLLSSDIRGAVVKADPSCSALYPGFPPDGIDVLLAACRALATDLPPLSPALKAAIRAVVFISEIPI